MDRVTPTVAPEQRLTDASPQQDVAAGIGLLALAGLYFLGTTSLPTGRDEPGPAFVPTVLAVALAIVALVILAQGIRSSGVKWRSPGQRTVELAHRSASWRWLDDPTWKPLAVAAISAASIALFQPLGFLASTWLYTVSVTVLVRGVSVRGLLLVPAVSTLLVYLLFRVALGVPLPSGPFG